MPRWYTAAVNPVVLCCLISFSHFKRIISRSQIWREQWARSHLLYLAYFLISN